MTTFKEVAEFLISEGLVMPGYQIPPSAGTREIRGVARDTNASADQLSWMSVGQFERDSRRLDLFRGAMLIAPVKASITTRPEVVPCPSPKAAFTAAVNMYFSSLSATRWPQATSYAVSESAVLGERVAISPGVVVGAGCIVGDDVAIGPNTCIANSTIGSRVEIGANCSIGLTGFGFEKDSTGRYVRFPHVGRVVIGDDVSIGSNTCIDRGSLGDTVIGAGCRIDNLVHIAHNVELGCDVLVIANSMIAGSVRIGDRAWIAPSASVLNQLSIGSDAVVGLGAVVVKHVEQASVVIGNPAKPREGPSN